MDLGRGKLRRNGINTLSGAVHPKHGLAWTDGCSVYLAPVHVSNGHLHNEPSTKLGQFEHVQSLHWSCDLTPGLCYLCVVHRSTVSIWRVEGKVPDLSIKQVRKINASPVPQGCLWNPRRDILCILNRDQCSFYFRHTQNKGNYALPPMESEKISCGCWSADGTILVVAVESVILRYEWADVDKSISDYNLVIWRVPRVEARISRLVTGVNNTVMCTVELPLDTLCRSPMDMFQAPALETDLNGSLSDTQEIDVIKPKDKLDSFKDRLLNLQQTKRGVIESSQLLVLSVQANLYESSKIASTDVKGILTPDMLVYDAVTDLIIVGSNTQNSVQVFQWHRDQLTKLQDIKLQKEERPKGVCGLLPSPSSSTSGVLITVGRPTSTDSTFLPSTSTEEYDLKLRYSQLHPGVWKSNGKLAWDTSCELPNGEPRVQLMQYSPINSDRVSSPENHNGTGPGYQVIYGQHDPEDNGMATEIRTGDEKALYNGKIQVLGRDTNGDSRALHTETVDFRDQPASFKNNSAIYSMMHGQSYSIPGTNGRTPGGRSDSDTDSDPRLSHHAYSPNSDVSADNSDGDLVQMSHLESQIHDQGSQISLLQNRIQEITRLLEDTACVADTSYQPAVAPQIVYLVHKSTAGQTIEEKKAFVLDKGRLQLEPVKQAFGLATVELIIDGTPCVLGCNVDGYIPVKFSPNTTMYISGR